MFENVRRDLARARQGNQAGEPGIFPIIRELANPGTVAILLYRFGYWANHLRVPPIRIALRVIHFILQYVFAWRAGIFIPVKAEIGPGMVIHTWGGGVFIPACRIGHTFTIIGGGVLFDYQTAGIGDEVIIGAGTKSVGKIRIGNRVRTGPNAVIQDDVPDDSLVFGNPGRVVRSASAFRRRPAAAPAAGVSVAATVPAQPESRISPTPAPASSPSPSASARQLPSTA